MILRPHIFRPERLDGESRDAYRARRAEANAWSPMGQPSALEPDHAWKDLKRRVGKRQARRLALRSYQLKAERNART